MTLSEERHLLFWLPPYKTLQLHSPLDAARAAEALLARLKPFRRRVRKIRLRKDSGEYGFYGEVTDGTFKVRHNITYRNSFLPVIEGEIFPGDRGCNIRVTMRMAYPIMVFMAMFYSIFLFIVYILLARGAYSFGHAASIIGMFLFSITLTVAGFYNEAPIAKKFLCETLQAKEQEQ